MGEFLEVHAIKRFSSPVRRIGTTLYCGTLQHELHTKIRLRHPRSIATTDVELL